MGLRKPFCEPGGDGVVTILHQLGIDHRRLTYAYQGLDQRLTGVEPARVVKEILA